MLNELSSIDSTPFYASQAYDLRSIAKQKRYTVQEISAHNVDEYHPQRAEVETFIYEVFKQAYGAHVTMFMPNLVALRDDEGTLMAAFGWRSAGRGGPLFLERYLDAPIEQVISERLGREISRDQITKIGNLAVANPRNAGILISHVVQHSLDIGIEWCVATVHHTLQNALIKAGRDVYPLFPADKNRLTEEEQAKWGTYYKHTPQVVAIRGIAKPL